MVHFLFEFYQKINENLAEICEKISAKSSGKPTSPTHQKASQKFYPNL